MRARAMAMILSGTLLLAACGGNGGDGDRTQGGGDGGGGGAGIMVTGTDNLRFQPSEVGAAAGTITVELTAEESVEHTFTVEMDTGDQTVVEAAAGETASGMIQLDPGSYVFYCEVSGHREAGMEGTLTVT